MNLYKLAKIYSIILIISGISLFSCSNDAVPKKGITKYVITRIVRPNDLEDRFIYLNDTLIEKAEIYNKGQLISIEKINRTNTNSLSLSSYAYPKFTEIQTIKSFTFSNGIINKISIVNSSNLNLPFQYDFEFDDQSRLKHYEYYNFYPNGIGDTHYLIEDAEVSWLGTGLQALITIPQPFTYPPVIYSTFTVQSEGEKGESIWSKLSQEALATIIFQDMHIIEYFVPNRIIGIESESYGSYTFDDFSYDVNGNPISVRRTNTGSGKVDNFKFEWKRVDL